ncbi:MAG: VanZ family protein [Gammaproteobacteria bacterium]|nr:VanZ family protein [Gammaproteobacteria bacterium]
MADSVRLRYHGIWVAIGLGLVTTLVVLSLIPAPPTGLDFEGSDKIEHMMGYAVLMGWFMQIYAQPTVRARIALALTALGFAVEILQGLGGVRYFDYLDAAANASGVLLAWWVLRPPFSRLLWHLERALA